MIRCWPRSRLQKFSRNPSPHPLLRTAHLSVLSFSQASQKLRNCLHKQATTRVFLFPQMGTKVVLKKRAYDP